jgi:hypothetical protein
VSESRPVVTLKVPNRVIPESMFRGVYATQIQQLSTQRDSIIDFSSVTPASYDVDDSGKLALDSIRLHAEVVARVIVPTEILNEFIRSYVRSNPAALQVPHLGAEDGEDGEDHGEPSDLTR